MNLNFGIHVVGELLDQSNFQKNDIIYISRSDDIRISELVYKAKKIGIKTLRVSYSELNRLVGHSKHQGIVLVKNEEIQLKTLNWSDLSNIPPGNFFLALDRIQDPHNMGAIMRTMVGMGASGLILSKKANAPIKSTVMKVSAGMAIHVPVMFVSSLASFFHRLHTKIERNWISLGLDSGGSDISQAINGLPFPVSVILVLGSEEKGLSRLVRERVSKLVSLPMEQPLESYNVSVAAALAMQTLKDQLFSK